MSLMTMDAAFIVGLMGQSGIGGDITHTKVGQCKHPSRHVIDLRHLTHRKNLKETIPSINGCMRMDDKQVGGDHYLRLEVQPWHVMEAWYGTEAFKSYLLMTALKYLARDKADKVEDVQKAIHYLEKWVSLSDSLADH